ncbi:MAG: secretin N-terminal domain-containing protein [Candidatus Omnitrophota bacterium]
MAKKHFNKNIVLKRLLLFILAAGITASVFMSALNAQEVSKSNASATGGLQSIANDVEVYVETSYVPDNLETNDTASVITENVAALENSANLNTAGTILVNENQETPKDTLSLDLRGIEITELLKVLSKKLKKNIIPSKNVTGRVTLFLNDIKYTDVLDILMISQGLAYEEKGDNIILVVTDAEYETLYGKKFNEKKKMITLNIEYASPKMVFTALSNLKSTVGNIIVDEITGTIILIDIPQKLDEMITVFRTLDSPNATEVFELQYATAEDIEEDISSILTEGAGSVFADERTNSLVVTDLPGNMNRVKQAIQMLDQPTKQVFIEAAIVQITLEDEFFFGIEWTAILNNPSFWGTVLTGSFANAGIAATDPFQRITLGSLPENNFKATLNMLNSLGDIKILSRPTIAVTNNEEAVIHVGKREAIVTGTTSQSGESTITSDSVEFVDIGLKLTVVPTINRDGFITMKIKPEVSSVTSTVTTGSEDEPRSIIPIITTSEAETTVKIKDGSMIMIAGLRESDNRKSIGGVPYLDEIPIIGSIFSNRTSEKNQTEIVVFLTPHIIEGDQMMAWDLEKLEEVPSQLHPENRGYFEPKLKESSLRKRKSGR